MLSFTAIAAVARNGVLAREGAVPWESSTISAHYPDDLTDSPVVMGRTTYEEVGVVTADENVILTTQPPSEAPPNVTFVRTPEEAFAFFVASGIDHVYNVGGGESFRVFLSHTEQLVIAELHESYEGDVFFPYLDAEEWVIQKCRRYEGYDVVTYERRGIRHQLRESGQL